jgi:hypothetical protein
MWNVSAEIKCKKVERGIRDNWILYCGIKEFRLPLIHIGALKSPSLKCSIRVLVLCLEKVGLEPFTPRLS